MLKLLAIDDSAGDVEILRLMLGRTRFKVDLDAAPNLREGALCAQASSYDAIFLDLNLPDSRGVQTIRTLRSAVSDIPIYVLSGLVLPEQVREYHEAGASGVFEKGGVDFDSLLENMASSKQE